MPCTNLSQHYKFWDDFVYRWQTGRIDTQHLPEPWWGWSPNTGHALHSVVLNLNPGEGGPCQERGVIEKAFTNKSYSQSMADSSLATHLPCTQRWHNDYRAKLIIAKLGLDKILEPPYTNYHLSVEISPIHTAHANGLEEYVEKNFNEVVTHSLLFAAEASHHAAAPLTNMVIVRCGAIRFKNLFKKLKPKPITDEKVSPCWIEFPDERFNGVKFVCVWGARNHLPHHSINAIIETIQNKHKY